MKLYDPCLLLLWMLVGRAALLSYFLVDSSMLTVKSVFPYSLHHTLHRAKEKTLKSRGFTELYQVIALPVDKLTCFLVL